MSKFNIGDKVRMIKDWNGVAKAGMTATVVCIDDRHIGICFDNYNYDFHGCDGRCKEGYGFYVAKSYLEKINKGNTKATLNKKNNFLPSDVKEVYIHNNNVVVILEDGCKGVSKCSNGDTFDAYCGFANAYYRAKNEHIFELKNVLNNCIKSAEKKGYKQAILRNS